MPDEQNIPSRWSLVDFEEAVEILDSRREPISSDEREKRTSGVDKSKLYPYYGAGRQIGWIDDYIFDDELILLAEDGATTGYVYMVDGKSWINNHAHVLKENPSIVDKMYLFYYLKHYDFDHLKTGGTRPKLTQTNMKKVKIPVPPLDEQERIVEAVEERLERVERLEKSVENVGRLADEYESSMVNYLFYDRKKGKKFEDWNSLHEGLPKNWNIKTLGEIGSFRNGKYLPKKDMIEDAEYPVFGSNGVIGRYNESWISDSAIVIGRVGSCGEVNRVKDEAWVTDNAIVFWPDEDTSFNFLYKFLEEYNFEPLIREASQPLIRQGDVKNIEIPIPPVEKQNEIVREVDSTDFTVISKSARDLNKLFNEYRDSILAHAFKGEIDY